MTYVLAFDTATEHIAIGLAEVTAGRAGDPILSRMVAETDFAAPRAALGEVLPATRELLDSVGMSVSDLGVVAAGRGPGSFTGVRIGVASAKGLAHGLGVPLVGLGTLDAVAQRFSAHEGLLGVVGDAMRGEVYPVLFRCAGGRCVRLEPDSVERPQITAARWTETIGEPLLVTGNGLTKHRAVFEEVLDGGATFADEELWAPTGVSLISAALAETGQDSLGAVIGLEAAVAYRSAHPGALLPVYTRLSDAEEAERARSGGVPASGVQGPGGGGA